MIEAASKRRVVLRADAGRTVGFGHFVRTCALAAYLRDDFDCRIVSHNPSGAGLSSFQGGLIEEAGASYCPVIGGNLEDFDISFLKTLRSGDIAVLDNYYFSTHYQEAVKKAATALVCIDDVHDRHFVADAVITFCPLERSDFSLEPDTRFLGGVEWSFLRAPFIDREIPPRRFGKPAKIAMAMGGADPFGLTDKMVSLVLETIPGCCVELIAGQTVNVSHPSGRRLKVNYNVSASEIVRVFDSCDFGVFPASTVCVEAFARRLPVAAGHYVDNQKEFYETGVSKEWFAPLGSFFDPEAALAARLEEAVARIGKTGSPVFDFKARKQDIVSLFKSFV